MVSDAGAAPPADGSVGPPAARDAAKTEQFGALRRQLDAEFPRVAGTPSAWLDDACLWRHLRARDYNVSSAAAQVRETFTWRQSFGVDPLMAATAAAAPAVSAAAAAPPPGAVDDGVRLVHDESATGKQYVHGVCAAGRPVLYMCPGQQNSSSTRGNLLQLVYSLERGVAAMPPGVEKLTLLIDFRGYSWRVAPSFATQRATLTILQHHYPERLGLAVLWGAPKLFHLAYKAIKPFIDPVTAAKIVFLYPGVPADAARMGELFAADELLAAYGGGSPWVYSNKEYFGVEGGGGVLPPHMR